MRPHLALLALLLLSPALAQAGTVVVDPFQRRVETTRLKVIFDSDNPEIVRVVTFKDYDPNLDLAADEYSQTEFWGQSLRGAQGEGSIQPLRRIFASWRVVLETPEQVDIAIESQSENQAPVSTRYSFFADQPYFVVDRYIRYSWMPESSAVQVYVPRVAFVSPYRAVRWRTTDGRVLLRNYCAAGCTDQDWNGRWLQHIGIRNNLGFSVASLYPDWLPSPTALVRGSGPLGSTGEIAPLQPAMMRTHDLRSRAMIAFSTNPDDLAALDSLQAYFSANPPLDVPAAGAARLALSAWPNPARGEHSLAWSLPADGAVDLAVFDVSGRRVATLHAGATSAGPHSSRWDGRDASGRTAPPGLYLARLVSAGGTRTARLVRIR